MQNFPHVTRK